MAFGLKIWDASGNLMLDLSRNIGRILGSFDTSGSSGSHTDANLALGTPFFFSVPLSAAVEYFSPSITVAGNTISYAWSNTTYVTASRIFYGIY